jgi:glycosyltransferase involved in cell wall biosynthesis
VLALASTDPRKNIEVLFRAAAPSGGHAPHALPLKVVCTNNASAGYVSDKALQYGITDVEILRGLTDSDLAREYRHAAVFVFPSRLEGFGLPPLEAMAQGCPVVSSTAPSMPEVLGEAPLWFDPDKPEELADTLKNVLSDGRLRLQLSIRGRERAGQFTLRRMADQTEQAWKTALESVTSASLQNHPG